MRTILILTEAALMVGLVVYGFDGSTICAQPIKNATIGMAVKKDRNVIIVPENSPVIIEGTTTLPATVQTNNDEEAIRQKSQFFEKAYAEGNASSIAAQFTMDAEYIDELGNVFQGRESIEKSMTEFFADNPSCELEIKIDTIRFISPGVAVEDGNTKLKRANDSSVIESRYTTIYVKSENSWLAASIRDHAPKDNKEHRSHLEQLSWLTGDWVQEGDDSIINFSCQPTDNGNYLLRKYSILIAGQEAKNGTERIGWDPLSGRFRVWLFDSEGSYGEGIWHQDGANWILKLTGVTADGQTASSTSVYTIVNDHEMTWQSIEQEIAGVQQPDSEIIRLVSQAPIPGTEITVEVK